MPLRREDFGPVVASHTFERVNEDGSRTRIEVRIGLPYAVTDQEWACPTELAGLDRRAPDFRGTSALQALCLSLGYARARLGHLVEDGSLSRPGDEMAMSNEALDALFGRSAPRE